MASVPSATSSATLATSSRPGPPIRPTQPPCRKPSSPAGSWMTPSSVTFSLMMIFPILVLLRQALSATTDADTAAPPELGARRLPSASRPTSGKNEAPVLPHEPPRQQHHPAPPPHRAGADPRL